jgi:hypothetical protein
MAISISFGLALATLWILYLVPAIFSIYAKCVLLPKPATGDGKPDQSRD